MILPTPLHSELSQTNIMLSSDIPLSKQELQAIEDKIRVEVLDTPCWIYIGDKMYLIERKQVDETATSKGTLNEKKESRDAESRSHSRKKKE